MTERFTRALLSVCQYCERCKRNSMICISEQVHTAYHALTSVWPGQFFDKMKIIKNLSPYTMSDEYLVDLIVRAALTVFLSFVCKEK